MKKDNNELNNKLFDAAGDIDEKYISEYDKSVIEGMTMQDPAPPDKKIPSIWKRVLPWTGAAAAVFAGVVIGGGYLSGKMDMSKSFDANGIETGHYAEVGEDSAPKGSEKASGKPDKAASASTKSAPSSEGSGSSTEKPADATFPAISDPDHSELIGDKAAEINHYVEMPDCKGDIRDAAEAVDPAAEPFPEEEHYIWGEPDVVPMPGDDSEPVPETEPIPASPFLLTCGRWNDNSNWGFFTNLVKTDAISFPAYGLNPTDRITVSLKDADGALLAGYRVDLITMDEQIVWSGRTGRAGSAYLFRDNAANEYSLMVYDLSGQLCYSGLSEGLTLKQEDAAEGQGRAGGKTEFELTVGGASAVCNKTQVMFILDTTGSMSDELTYLQADFSKIMEDVTIPNTSYSLNFYRDEGDDYVTKTNPFGSDVKELQKILNNELAEGGGDFPEAVDQILKETMNSADWDDDAVKIAFMIFDAPPHDGTEQVIIDAIKTAAAKGIHIIPVISSGSDRETELFGRAMAIMTDGEYVFLTDDSGIGGSHLEPIIGSYEVQKLHDVIVDLINEYSGVTKAE